MSEDKETPEKPDEIMDQAKKLLQERNSHDAFFNMGRMIGSFVAGMHKAGCSDDQIRLALPLLQNVFIKNQQVQDKKE